MLEICMDGNHEDQFFIKLYKIWSATSILWWSFVILYFESFWSNYLSSYGFFCPCFTIILLLYCVFTFWPSLDQCEVLEFQYQNAINIFFNLYCSMITEIWSVSSDQVEHNLCEFYCIWIIWQHIFWLRFSLGN